MTEPLKRRIGLGLLTAYGVGVMVGAGIYVLVGAVVAEAGTLAPFSFLLAGLIAAPTALSYAEFSSRLPEAAGEAAFVGQGLSSPRLAIFVGLSVVLAGTISAGAVLRGGAGYFAAATGISPDIAILAMGIALTAVAVLGVLESFALVAVFTAIEIAGLALVIWAGFGAEVTQDWSTAAPAITALAHPAVLTGVSFGAVLAFFAFIGFEDIVNMAEEVRHPTRVMPRAIMLSLAITSVVYALVCWAAVRAVPLQDLAQSQSPLALVWQVTQGGNAHFLSSIAVFAALNGVLAQIVMASRVLFGLGRRTATLHVFRQTHHRFGTPVRATVLIGGAVVAAAYLVPLSQLAEMTSTTLLAVFILVNLALILQKRRAPEASFRVPMLVPVVGLLLSLGAFSTAIAGML
ncbi:putative amino acid permease YhdG [Phaeobacter sp. CECT 5382]|uniref:APC family permease n=1 Tax=Phaeobacter sp. CECT 5382 TaxID=1712645 RepID=UPI0006DB8DD4|nr:amino acid permease [Phaeobacter sp. CECT 5382]CUH86440.1 putative amino acid permease YhdG [Phaeobacter sp. CECT 5382]